MICNVRLAALLGLLGLAACGTYDTSAEKPIGSFKWPIVGGSLDTNADHAAVAFIEIYDSSSRLYSACSGTLVSSRVVLTAAHCVSDDNGSLVATPTRYGVFFDTNHDGTPDWPAVPWWLTYPSGTAHKNVAEVRRASGYTDDWNGLQLPSEDIALLVLSGSAPSSITPIPYLTSSLAGGLVAGATVEFVGFGDQDYPGVNCCDSEGQPWGCSECPSGTRFHVSAALSSVCNRSSGCSGTPPWTISYLGDQGPCSGDSGGPALFTVGGRQYVAGVTSYGDWYCQTDGVSAKVDHFESFIAAAIGGAQSGEACSQDSACASGHCLSGVCCESACEGPCASCSSGTCQPLAGACDDGDPCTEADACSGGACVGVEKSCPAAGGCEAASCDPGSGQCVSAALPEGSGCDDGNARTVSDRCLAGVCTGELSADCSGLTDGTSCSGGTCQSGSCVAGAPVKGGCGCGAAGMPMADGLPVALLLVGLRRRRGARALDAAE